MITKISKREKYPYGKYFLAFEAPGDDDTTAEVTTAVVEPDMDFNTITDDDPTEMMQHDEPDTNFNGDGTEEADMEPQDETNTGNIENQQDNPDINFNGTDTETDDAVKQQPEETEEVNTEVDEADDGTTPDPENATSGYEDQNTDFNTENETEPVPEDTTDGAENAENNEDDKGPGLDYDSTRRYRLFKDFMSLYTAVDGYAAKLNGTMNDSVEINQLNKIAVDKFVEIRSLLYDYMLLKFDLANYVQALMFYQTMVVAVQSVFNLLNSRKIKQIKNNISKQ